MAPRPKRKRVEKTGTGTLDALVKKKGGVVEVCAVLKVSNRTLYRWCEEDEVPLLKEALGLAELAATDAAGQMAFLRKIAPKG